MGTCCTVDDYRANPDRYWEARGGAGYISTLSTEHKQSDQVQRVFFGEIIERIRPVSLLDFGCGTGRLFDLWDAYKIREVFGYDRSRSQLQIARDLGFPFKLMFANGNVRNRIPYEDHQFDLVVACEVLPHVLSEEITGMLYELHRVCRNRLALVVSSPTHPMQFHSTHHDYDVLLSPLFSKIQDKVVDSYRFIEAEKK